MAEFATAETEMDPQRFRHRLRTCWKSRNGPSSVGTDRHLVLDSYHRVSRVSGRGGSDFLSPKTQTKLTRGKAKITGARLRNEEFDDHISGGLMHRPKLLAIIAAIERKEIDGMLIPRHASRARCATSSNWPNASTLSAACSSLPRRTSHYTPTASCS